MKEYRYSTIEKVKLVIMDIVVQIIVGAFCLLLSQIYLLKYIIWIPFAWLAYHSFRLTSITFTIIFKTDDVGLTLMRNKDKMKIAWEEIEKINITRRRGEIVRLDIFHRILKKRVLIDDGFKNYKELFETILINVKKKNNKVVIVEKTEDLFHKGKNKC
ncbi:hypothetical protein KAW08_00395 [bacterium]|nr:hypothetical protein [bacterium]